jgi:16S rRNA (cytidine1402-2'-O)-methyltransferase
MAGTLFVVATPIGNLEDVTARALRVLREVSIIAAEDTRRTARLLARYGIATATTSLHEHNERHKAPPLIERLRRGEDVALVSDAGTPTIADPGVRLVREAARAGVRVETVPGPNAAVASLAVSGFPSDTFCFLGFPPTTSRLRATWFEQLQLRGGTVVFYEAPHRILRTLTELQQRVGDREILVCRELTKAHEQLVRGPISVALQSLQSVKGEFTVVVNLGHMIEMAHVAPPEDSKLADEFYHLTETAGISRREAVAAVAKRHSLSRNLVYRSLENAKKSVE